VRDVWDVVGVLSQAPCPTRNSVKPDADSTPSEGPEGMDEDRRAICWSINNLAVPYEKKDFDRFNRERRSAAASEYGLRQISHLRRRILLHPF